MTPDDFASIESTVGEYLDDIAIPAPPSTWWEIDLPDVMTADQLADAVHDVAVALESEDAGVDRACRYARAVIDFV